MNSSIFRSCRVRHFLDHFVAQRIFSVLESRHPTPSSCSPLPPPPPAAATARTTVRRLAGPVSAMVRPASSGLRHLEHRGDPRHRQGRHALRHQPFRPRDVIRLAAVTAGHAAGTPLRRVLHRQARCRRSAGVRAAVEGGGGVAVGAAEGVAVGSAPGGAPVHQLRYRVGGLLHRNGRVRRQRPASCSGAQLQQCGCQAAAHRRRDYRPRRSTATLRGASLDDPWRHRSAESIGRAGRVPK